jgi:integrase/recombinase XerD
LLNAPDVATNKGLRDRAILAVLLGCGLRRSEVASLTLKHIQLRESRWCIVDLVGKHARIRTVPVPTWVKVAIDAWTSATGVTKDKVFRSVNRADQPQGALSEKVVWQLLQRYAQATGVPGIAPMTSGAPARRCAGPSAASWSRSSCCSVTRRCRGWNATSGQSRICCTRRTTESS